VRRAVIIANYDYKISWGAKTPDQLALPTIKKDIDNLIHWLINTCKFRREEIVVLENAKAIDAKKYFCKTVAVSRHFKRKFINHESESEGGVFQFVYYAGHGQVIDGMNHAIMTNEEKRNDYQPYNLERELLGLKRVTPDIYVFAVFDCCREIIQALPG
jgi:hypothetical protein